MKKVRKQAELSRTHDQLMDAFHKRGLDPHVIHEPMLGDLNRENRWLRQLLTWVEGYEKWSSRKAMEARGFLFPPVEPDLGPDADWERFIRWMEGKPLSSTLKQLLPHDFDTRKPDELSEEEILHAISMIEKTLKEHHTVLEIQKQVPPRLLYEGFLHPLISDDFEIYLGNNGGGTWHLDGCSGYCPECIQRPWCDVGQKDIFSEDEEAGCMKVPALALKYAASWPADLEQASSGTTDIKAMENHS